jgi:hypothetical protein
VVKLYPAEFRRDVIAVAREGEASVAKIVAALRHRATGWAAAAARGKYYPSSLARGELGLVQSLNFLVLGLMALVFAQGLRTLLSYKRLALRYDRTALTINALARLAVTLICPTVGDELGVRQPRQQAALRPAAANGLGAQSRPVGHRQADDAVARGAAIAKCRNRRRDSDPLR